MADWTFTGANAKMQLEMERNSGRPCASVEAEARSEDFMLFCSERNNVLARREIYSVCCQGRVRKAVT